MQGVRGVWSVRVDAVEGAAPAGAPIPWAPLGSRGVPSYDAYSDGDPECRHRQ
jgi:hypothetical protein